jgi:pyruvate kinase
VPTRTGSTAIKAAEFRPRQPILAISTHPLTVGRLTLSWGVIPLLGNEIPSHEAMLNEAERVAVEAGLLEEGDLVVITAGFPVGGPGSTNTVTVKRIGEGLTDGWDKDAAIQQDLFRENDGS